MEPQIIVKPWDMPEVMPTGVWIVEISNVGKLNAMTRSMWSELRVTFEQLQSDKTVRCIVVRGAGNAFCAGGDISEYPAFRFDERTLSQFHEEFVWGGLNAILACDVPIVACINGVCMGAGLEIASCCDIRLVNQAAKFGAPIAKLGFPMAPKEMRLITSAVGRHTAKRMLLEAAVLDAFEMATTGWCVEPLETNLLQQHVYGAVQRIACLSPLASRLNKQTMRNLVDGSMPETPYSYAAAEEHKEGVMAFLEKRKPRF